MARINKEIYEALLNKDEKLAEIYQKEQECEYSVLFKKGETYTHKGKSVVLEEDYYALVHLRNEPDLRIWIDHAENIEDSTHLCNFITSVRAYFLEGNADTFMIMVRDGLDKSFFRNLAHNIERLEHKIVKSVQCPNIGIKGDLTHIRLPSEFMGFQEFYVKIMQEEENIKVLKSEKFGTNKKSKFMRKKRKEAWEQYKKMMEEKQNENK